MIRVCRSFSPAIAVLIELSPQFSLQITQNTYIACDFKEIFAFHNMFYCYIENLATIILMLLLLSLKSYDYNAEQHIIIVEEYNNYPSISSDQI